MKKYLWGILYALFLTAFTVYVLMDTFVIERVYSIVQPENDGVGSESGQGGASPILTAVSYADDNISITITEYREGHNDLCGRRTALLS